MHGECLKVVKRKLKNNKIEVMHSFLKPKTRIKIINPINGISLDTIISKKSPFPKIFNVVITEEIASVLKLNTENPYIEIREVKKNETFIAKEGSIFEEERKVADKAPVNEIKMDDITQNEKKKKKTKSKKIEKYILVISDFYYLNSANNLKKELVEKNKIDNISIKKINNNKYRLLAGPFENFNALKTTYISLNNLGFEDLNIYKE